MKLPYWNHNTAYYPWIKKKIKQNSRVLDVGCGDGTLAYFLSDVAADVDAIDAYSDAIEIAQQNYGNISGLRFTCRSFEEYEAVSCYDAVLFSASLHHMELLPTIQKAKKLLRDNGVLLVVGLAYPTSFSDYVVEAARVIPSYISSLWHRMKTSEQVGVVTSYQLNTMGEIREVIKAELPDAKLRSGLHYRYLIYWEKKQ